MQKIYTYYFLALHVFLFDEIIDLSGMFSYFDFVFLITKINLNMKQRLCIYLDGTWNTENNSTNVQHAFNLTIKGQVPDGVDDNGHPKFIYQKKFYDRGVGTGLIDGITGGVFGYGLEENIREAYVWLMQNYNPGDEIFIFGFSRGAFTARSLVGMLSKVGLIKKGAPIPIQQVWDLYVSYKSERIYLNQDSNYRIENNNIKYNKSKNKKFHELSQDLRKMSNKWMHKKKPKINYLGIYDTVGALGISALGLPGMISKADKKHSYYPTSKVLNCRHALAIDENRSSFEITRLLEYVENGKYEKRSFIDKIEQRWFVGAHSNIGGGYPDNYLSTEPFKWIISEANKVGLQTSDLYKPRKTPPVKLRDSYAEFAGLIWPHILREKRNHRTIAPIDDFRPNARLRAINERIDDSVFTYASRHSDYAPPNLLAHFDNTNSTSSLRKRISKHEWIAMSTWWSSTILILWGIVSGLGVCTWLNWLNILPTYNLIELCLAITVLIYIIDWYESIFGHLKSRYPRNSIFQVWWNVALWHRFLALAFFVIGLVKITPLLILALKNLIFNWHNFTYSNDFTWAFPLVIFIISMSMFFIDYKISKGNLLMNISKRIVAPTIGSILSLFILENGLSILNVDPNIKNPFIPDSLSSLLGATVLIFLLFYMLTWVVKWVTVTMGNRRAALGSIFLFQFSFTKTRLENVLSNWLEKIELTSDGIKHDIVESKQQLKSIIDLSVYRDAIGFVPIYCISFILFIWLGNLFYFDKYIDIMDVKLHGVSMVGVVVVCFLLDQLENISHLYQIWRFNNSTKHEVNGFICLVSSFISLLKTIVFLILSIYSIFFIGYILFNLYKVADAGHIRLFLLSVAILIVLHRKKLISIWRRFLIFTSQV